MLSPSLFQQTGIFIEPNDLHYETVRVLGQPIILMHNETGQPLASVHYYVKSNEIEYTDQVMIAPVMTPERNRDYDHYRAVSDCAAWNGRASFLVTNLLFDQYIAWEVQGKTEEPMVCPPGKTFKWDFDSTLACKVRICSLLGKTFQSAFWTRKQLLCRPRIPMDARGVPTTMDHPAIVGGDSELVKSADMAGNEQTPDNVFFNHGSPWIFITPIVTERLMIPPVMSRRLLLKKSLSLLEECIMGKNQRLLQRCREIRTEDQCVICLDGTPDCTMVPCGHKCAHADCLDGMEQDAKCPMCRADILHKVV